MSSKNLITLAPMSPAQQTAAPISLTRKLEGVRSQLRFVQRDIQITEGRLLDYSTAEALQRSLHHSIRQLEAITITVSVLERKGGAHNG